MSGNEIDLPDWAAPPLPAPTAAPVPDAPPAPPAPTAAPVPDAPPAPPAPTAAGATSGAGSGLVAIPDGASLAGDH